MNLRTPNLSRTPEERTKKLLWRAGLVAIFLGAMLAVFFFLYLFHAPDTEAEIPATDEQYTVFTVCGAALMAGLITATVAAVKAQWKRRPIWLCPLVAAGLGLALYCLSYAFMGVWPIGDKSTLTVDLHHQYAPLISELRAMLLGDGGGALFNFHIGMGAAFIPTFAYYLSSPLNLLMVLLPEAYLTDGIVLMTLIKGAAMAAAFTALVQYLYRRRTAGMVAVGLLYALSGFSLAYSWNIMWLDVLVLLPVVVLAMEHMLNTGRMLPYILSLALALFCNYYIGFMLCIFLVLYMGVWLLRRRRTIKERLFGCLRFGIGSLWGGALVAFLLLPTAVALGRTSAAGGELGDFLTNFPLFDALGRFFYGATPTIRSGNLPNLYCGVIAVLVAPIYFAQSHIPLRRRLSFGGLLAVMLFSCALTQPDLIWHGLHAPNDLPYRFSFLVSFVVLLMVAHVLANVRKITTKQVGVSLTASVVFLFLWEKLGALSASIDAEAAAKVTTTPEFLYFNVLLLAGYAVVLFVGALKKAPSRVMSRLLLCTVCAELLFITPVTLMTINENEYFTRREDYIDNYEHQVIDAAMRRVEEIAEENGDVFYRAEYLPRTTCVDTALHHYSGLTTFASSNPYWTTLFMGDLGYAINGVNSYLYKSYVGAVDSLFALKYLVLKNKMTSHPQLELVDEVYVEDPATGGVMEDAESGEKYIRYIYRNRLALPLGFAASDKLAEFDSIPYSPFECQQELYQALTGLDNQIYYDLEFDTNIDGASISDNRFQMPGDATFTATVEEKGQYFAFVDCRAANTISVDKYDAEDTYQNTWHVTPHEPFIIDMGTLTPGERVEVAVSGDYAASGNCYVMRLDADALAVHLDELRSGGLDVTWQDGSGFGGSYTAKEAGTMFFSVPYDQGWTVLVDGKAVETFPIDNNYRLEWNEETEENEELGGDDGALLGAYIPAGTHKVEVRFTPEGLHTGITVSGIALILLLGLVALKIIYRKRLPVPPTRDPQPEEDEVEQPEEGETPLWDDLEGLTFVPWQNRMPPEEESPVSLEEAGTPAPIPPEGMVSLTDEVEQPTPEEAEPTEE